MTGLVFGRVTKPPIIEAIVPKPYDGAGFTRVVPRRNRLVGSCLHSWYGNAWTTPRWKSIYSLFATGGERQFDALVDFSVQKDGTIVMLNDPFGTRSPWANGGSNGLEGDGPAFVRALGVGAINDRLLSIEREGAGEPMPPVQLEAVAHTIAWLHDLDLPGMRVPWDAFPLNPKVNLVTQMQHYEFATKGCPFPGVIAQTDAYQDRARSIMKAAQTAVAVPAPTPPPAPVTNPGHTIYPAGMDEQKARAAFGTGRRINPDGTTHIFGFDPKGLISNAWLAEGAKRGAFPAVRTWYVLGEGTERRDLVTFADGWELFSDAAVRSSWRWL